MRRWSYCLVPLLGVLVTLGSWAAEDSSAEPTEDDSVAVEVFKGPRPRGKLKPAQYPFAEIEQGREGWVTVHMMISRQGEPYEISVVDSTGNEALEKAAVEGVRRWRFEPASVDGEPVDSGIHYKVGFRLTGDTGARSEYVKAYKRVMRAIGAGDRVAADSELSKLVAENLYEDAFSGIANYSYAVKWGSKAQRLDGLRRAIADEDSATFLPKDLYRIALLSMLPLELEGNDFAAAMKTWDRLQRAGAKQAALEEWRSTIERVQKVKTDDTSYGMRGAMGDRTSWFVTLFKKRFGVNVISGRISEVKLRCDKQYVFFPFQAQLQYKVAEKYGECHMELVGDKGTTFDLIQS